MRVPFLILVLLGFAGQAAAQESEVDEPPCVPIEGSALEQYQGSWDVDWRYRTEPGVYQDLAAVAQFEIVLAGCALVETFTGRLRGVSFESVSTVVRGTGDAANFVRSRIDSEHGAFGLANGVLESDSLVFETQREFGERTMRTRHVYGPVHAESFRSTFYLSRSLDEPFVVVQEAVYTRRDDVR